MAMDKRQTEIVEGAGLDENRLNQDLIDFLNKWGSPALFAMALIAAGWWFWNYRAEQKVAYRDAALVELEGATLSGNPNPITLVALADDYADVPGVAPRALLAAADVRLSAASRGIVPGTAVGPDGTVEEDEVLTDDERLDEFDKAGQLYRRAWEMTRDDPDMSVHALGAASGMAAVAESLGDIEASREAYQRLIELAERAGFEQQAVVAKQRLETLEERLASAPTLYAQADLPEERADRPLPGEELVTPEIEGSTEVVGPEAPAAPEGEDAGDDGAAEASPQAEPGAEPPAEPAPEPGDG